ncbi:MAG: hypothetical protein WDO12_00300 [Pseudomonadota bacterium]
MINLSGSSTGDPEMADYVARCLGDNKLAGECLGFELTETVAIGNVQTCGTLMSRLRGLGCVIAPR